VTIVLTLFEELFVDSRGRAILGSNAKDHDEGAGKESASPHRL